MHTLVDVAALADMVERVGIEEVRQILEETEALDRACGIRPDGTFDEALASL
jgi:hypothetical protein